METQWYIISGSALQTRIHYAKSDTGIYYYSLTKTIVDSP